MKKIGFIIFLSIFLFASSASCEVEIALKAKFDGSVVKLRWYPMDKNLNYEYKLYRSEGDKTKTEPVLLRSLKMASYQEAKEKVSDDGSYALKLLYPFETAKNGQEKNAYLTQMENRLNMVVFISMQKPEIAELIGQYYLDEQIEKDKVYFYTIKTYSQGQEISSREIRVSTKNPYIPTGVWGVQANKFPWGVGLKWEGYAGFLGFNVFRSEHLNGEYKKINRSPVQVQEAANPDGTVDVAPYFYTDKTVREGEIYYYKIQALDLFGDLGPYSEVAIGQVKIDHKPAPPSRPELEISEDSISLSWNKNDGKTVGYNVYRAPNSDGPYTRLNKTMVNDTSYRDDTVTVDHNYFYVITAINAGGYESLRSLAVLGVPVDVTPPPIVQELTFALDQATVNTTWSEVVADDLLGYRVYRTMDLTNIDWQLLTQDPVPKPMYADVLTKNLSRYPYYYRITSVDTHFNESAPSPQVKVQLPDVTPPRPPSITGSSVREGQVALTWSQVHTYDLAGFNVYREVAGQRAKINENSFVHTSYVDAQPPVAVPVIYTVVAVDESGNESDPSSSVNLSVRDHIKPQISSFKAAVVNGEVILTVHSKATDLAGFDVLRSHNKRDFLKISHARIMADKFVDARVKKGKRYFYKVILWDEAANSTESTVRVVRVAK
ncbi:fibronectin type 3 domain-containing protein [Desulfuromusa kysingii]|uniref:Fibronectin type 3 domain-containing protein n=1 Tax=Desulfuromusa kysingii TaxID=37625 RepID=A0A1H4CA55_9BACT|nr:hypothetical protein [Desulfuromusa kysingii]SEA57223.1 fibronectin type 3 domain-containing protein [Desulfuromusa kysingii]